MTKKYKNQVINVKLLGITSRNYQHSQPDIQELIIDSKHLKDQQDITDAFNNYFLSVIDKISKKM